MSFSIKWVGTSAAEEVSVGLHHDVLFIYIQSEHMNADAGVGYVYI